MILRYTTEEDLKELVLSNLSSLELELRAIEVHAVRVGEEDPILPSGLKASQAREKVEASIERLSSHYSDLLNEREDNDS